MSEVKKLNLADIVSNIGMMNQLKVLLTDSKGNLKQTGTVFPMMCDSVSVSMDVNGLTETGIYRIQSTSTNVPSGTFRGILIVFKYTSVYQVLLTPNGITANLRIFFRASLNDDWSDWKEVATK